jgi:hypothetical protein
LGGGSGRAQSSTSSPYDLLTSRVEGYREYRSSFPRAGTGRCTATGHEDRHGSLDITEGDDGRVLFVCRSGGCDWESIVSGAGLSPYDLFPQRLAGGYGPVAPRRRPRPSAEGCIRVLAMEACIVYAVGASLLRHADDFGLDEPILDELTRAVERIGRVRAVGVARGWWS